MHNPIKRVWKPKVVQASAAAVAPDAVVASAADPVAVIPATLLPRKARFDNDMPEPDVEEKNSDSIWAEFGSDFSSELGRK